MHHSRIYMLIISAICWYLSYEYGANPWLMLLFSSTMFFLLTISTVYFVFYYRYIENSFVKLFSMYLFWSLNFVLLSWYSFLLFALSILTFWFIGLKRVEHLSESEVINLPVKFVYGNVRYYELVIALILTSLFIAIFPK